MGVSGKFWKKPETPWTELFLFANWRQMCFLTIDLAYKPMTDDHAYAIKQLLQLFVRYHSY